MSGYVGDYFSDEVTVVELTNFTLYEDEPLVHPVGFIDWDKLRRIEKKKKLKQKAK